jgi:DNA-nicking Smr family endonuclease
MPDFKKAMLGVQKIKPSDKVALAKNTIPNLALEARRKAAAHELESELNELSGEFFEPVEPNAVLSFQRVGIQHGVFKSLRQGKYPLDACLDLHGHTVEQARTALNRFVQDCLQCNIRYGLITHGKGEGRKQPAVLKSCVNNWLPQIDSVLAFHSAQNQHGGLGATYVLLRKNSN